MFSSRFFTTIGIFLSTAWVLCNAEPATTTGAAHRSRIVLLGDSITAGFGLDDSAKSYPALLQAKIDQAGLPYEIVNAGVSGDTTAGGLRRVDWVLSRGADIFVVALGGNDGLRGIQPQQTEENLRAIIKRAREKLPSVSILIAGMQMPPSMGPEYAAQFKEVYPRVAKDTGATLIPFLLEGVGGVAGLNQPDMIHPNATGAKIVAENVWKVLQEKLRSR
jgi:acyl-CoA thioesterase-1